MSYETQRIECARCGCVDGPFVERTVEQFSASGARPDLTFHYCESCESAARRWFGTRRLARGARYTDGH